MSVTQSAVAISNPKSKRVTLPVPGQCLYSVEQAGDYLGVTRWTIYRLIDDGELLGLPVKGCLRIELSDLDAYKARLRKKAEAKRAARMGILTEAIAEAGGGNRRPGRPRKPPIASPRQSAE
jgi:excisionase family DNA binding protein